MLLGMLRILALSLLRQPDTPFHLVKVDWLVIGSLHAHVHVRDQFNRLRFRVYPDYWRIIRLLMRMPVHVRYEAPHAALMDWDVGEQNVVQYVNRLDLLKELEVPLSRAMIVIPQHEPLMPVEPLQERLEAMGS